ncbi:ribosome small subunit-dependent GTPase A [Streptacidiphilus sp. PB12-B1b]|uniref:ribosome small subunit-dependent GTPase A n=1 Tax=Streptacidiphilus sp. PB12-B1b TaxID=2705012 RepID=UPI0015FBA8E7|nr:ribosome small subunit-dependent GTPase A [Streptacidiphilus sp. PB12-B1b]QMU75990.1 ribosome small subunit-dependent GTPase A [Streptacidiphilus sp. PB12-B1b]
MSDSSPAHPLYPYGWDEDWAAAFTSYAARPAFADRALVPGRVVRVDRGQCDVVTPTGPVRADTALVTPRDPMRVVCTGDWVAVDADGDPLFVRAYLPRRVALVRSTSSRRSEAQVLACNIDHIVICVSLAVEPDPGRIERFLALAWDSGAQPLIVLTKADLAADADHIREDTQRLAPGVDVLVVSATGGRGMKVLAGCLPGTSVLVGQSGVGKSTLANALIGSDAMEVQLTRGDGKGRHTTTTRELALLPGGGVLIDTPGLRGAAMYESGEGIQQAFAEIEELAEGCRFVDCGHASEPGCAVLEALEEGFLTQRRFDSYHKLLRENAWIAARTDARMRAEQLKTWKARSSSGRALARARARSVHLYDS